MGDNVVQTTENQNEYLEAQQKKPKLRIHQDFSNPIDFFTSARSTKGKSIIEHFFKDVSESDDDEENEDDNSDKYVNDF